MDKLSDDISVIEIINKRHGLCFICEDGEIARIEYEGEQV
jgi:hypothetical protein